MIYNIFENDFFLVIPEIFLFFYIILCILFLLLNYNLRFTNVFISISLLFIVILFFLILNCFTINFFSFN